MMEFAICQWQPDLSPEAIESLRAEGVTAIEPGPSFLLDRDAATLKADAGRLRAAGITVYSCHAPFGDDSDLSLPAEDVRRAAVARHVRALQQAALAGAQCLVIHPSGPVEPKEHALRLDRLRASLEALVRTAEQVHVRLALENMLPGYLGAETAALRALVDDIASPHLGACFDTGHAHVNKEHVVSALTALRERIVAFHLQDNDGNGDKHLQPPYGAIDWEAFRDELQSMAFAHPLAVEAAPWNGASWAVLLRELRALFSEGVLTVRVGDRSFKASCPRCGRYCFGTRQHWFCACG